jgi:hypothetical protein
MTCDFCGHENLTLAKVYGCRTFNVELSKSLSVNMIAEWVACDKCALLVDARNASGLLDRAIAEHIHSIELDHLNGVIAKLWATFCLFMDNRTDAGVLRDHV